ncbi:glutathione S-transferase family protein [Rhabdaerophilum calidifontis]|uniref:glutathione S-transferase family protein n=1 Tax=Rhabdaerophilum calidifontis TaxID=2604328 RepID=UPI001239BAEF|nr:glutathione S-transferase [Rhabdaerophilum calidifontis]
MAEFRLHGLGESGNAYKVALMLELSGADWELVPVAFFQGATREASWRANVNAMGEVPVLEHRSETLTQSGVILDYLATVMGTFAGGGERESREIWRWILFDNHKFTSYFATLRFLYGLQKTGETPVTEFLRGRARAAYQILDAHLATRSFVVGERATIADLSLAGYVFYDEETGLDRAAFTHIEAWKARIRALPGWKPPYALMPPAFAA